MAGAWKDVAAGTVGGVAICAVGHPFDTLKVRLQTQGGSAVAPATTSGGAPPRVQAPQLLYRNTWDCLVKTLRCASSSSTPAPRISSFLSNTADGKGSVGCTREWPRHWWGRCSSVPASSLVPFSFACYLYLLLLFSISFFQTKKLAAAAERMSALEEVRQKCNLLATSTKVKERKVMCTLDQEFLLAFF